MVVATDFPGLTDNEVLEAAIAARGADGTVVIPQRQSQTDPQRNWWLLDRAILLPENTTVILKNCKIKLSDRCRDNFFRSANCGLGIADPVPVQNIHIRGEGLCILEGADHPRATGDGSKILASPCPYLPEDACQYADWIPPERRASGQPDFWDMHSHSFGTDALVAEESHYGDWRGIGILLANVTHFSIENLHLSDTHGWGISLEACSHGTVQNLDFSCSMSLNVDGMLQNMENQDGIDLRNGCHHITISHITGHTGDDVIALTAIVPDNWTDRPGGSLQSTHVMPANWDIRDRDIHDITIRDVAAYSTLCWVLRLLPCNCHIWNITVDNITDTAPFTAPSSLCGNSAILLGEGDSAYGKNLPDGLSNISISNVFCHKDRAIAILGYLKNASIRNVINRKKGGITYTCDRPDSLDHVTWEHLVCAE